MFNQTILVGKIVQTPTEETPMILAVQRGFRNASTGDYDTDYIPVKMWKGIPEDIHHNCKLNTTIGVKARMVCPEFDAVPYLLAEKITFIS